MRFPVEASPLQSSPPQPTLPPNPHFPSSSMPFRYRRRQHERPPHACMHTQSRGSEHTEKCSGLLSTRGAFLLCPLPEERAVHTCAERRLTGNHPSCRLPNNPLDIGRARLCVCAVCVRRVSGCRGVPPTHAACLLAPLPSGDSVYPLYQPSSRVAA